MKVYVLTDGIYSGYHILAVFLDKTAAENAMKVFNSKSDFPSKYMRIEEYESDMFTDNRLQYEYTESYLRPYDQYRQEHIYLVDEYDLEHDSRELNKVKSRLVRLGIVYSCKILATDEQTALKIGRDLVAEYRAREAGI